MELKTKGGHVIKLKDQITGGEYQDIQDVLLATAEISQVDKLKMGTDSIAKMRDQSIRVIVISVDGKSEDVLEQVRKLPRADYQEVVEAVVKIRDGEEEKKTNKNSNSTG